MYQDVGMKKVALTAGVACSQTAGVYTGSGGTMVVVLWDDQALPGRAEIQTTFVSTGIGQWLPISIQKYVSGPADAVGIAF